MRTKFIVILGGVFLVSALYAAVGAQGKTVNDGIYSDEQAKRGDVLYKEQCATCHGDNLEGSGPMPALAGKDFLASWQGKTVGDLFEKTHTTMPATAPGSLTPAQAADITAYLLAANRYKAGTMELGPKVEMLAQIKIEAPAAQVGGKSVNDGVYTEAQAQRGDVLYKEQCATCHGDNLEGSGPMPALAGRDFVASWQGKTVGDLFEKTHTTMPATAPGSLTPEQAADITAYMLAASRYKAGTMELEPKVEMLAQIKIETPKE